MWVERGRIAGVTLSALIIGCRGEESPRVVIGVSGPQIPSTTGSDSFVGGNPDVAFEFPTPVHLSMRLDETCFDCGDAIPLRGGELTMIEDGPCTITQRTCSPGALPAYCAFEFELEDYGSCLFQMHVTTTDGSTYGHCFLLALFQRTLTDEDYRWFDETSAACREGL
jgi:hypothetical protein